MARSWITPKTNWTKSDKVAYSDYNRIRNNLLYINDMLNENYPDKAQTLDLGDALTYSANYLPSQFNAFENALESFTRVGANVNIGSKKTYAGNAPFIDYKELNRIEACCLRWYNYDPVIHVSSIEISPKTQNITIGESKTFVVTCLPENAEDKNNWVVRSSNTSVLTVSKSGDNVIATAVGVGNATISVSVYNSSATASVTVEGVLVTQIIPEKTEVDIPYWKDVYLNITLLPQNATNIGEWKVRSRDGNVSARKVDDTQIKLFGGKANKQSIVDIECGEVRTTINANVLNTAGGIWLSNAKGSDVKLGGTGLWVGQTRTIYVVTLPKDAIDKGDFTYTVTNPQYIDYSWNGDAFTFTGISKGRSYVKVSLNGFEDETYIDVH